MRRACFGFGFGLVAVMVVYAFNCQLRTDNLQIKIAIKIMKEL